MKRFLSTILLCGFLVAVVSAQTTTTYSQGPNLNYEITKQDAPKPWIFLGLDFFQLDMGIDNIDGASFNFGVRGYVSPVDRLGVDYRYQRSWLTGALSGYNRDFELGGHFLFQDFVKNKNTRVILEYDIDKGYDYDKGQRVETISMKSIRFPADRRIIRGVRGGLITKRGPYGIEDIEGIISADVVLNSNGFYLGAVQKILINVFADVQGHGNQYHSLGRDFSFDLLFFPNQTLTIENLEGTILTPDQIEERIGAGSVGWRIVYDMYQIEKKEFTGKPFGSTFRFEVGSKPYQGLYFAGSWGITLLKSKNRPF